MNSSFTSSLYPFIISLFILSVQFERNRIRFDRGNPMLGQPLCSFPRDVCPRTWSRAKFYSSPCSYVRVLIMCSHEESKEETAPAHGTGPSCRWQVNRESHLAAGEPLPVGATSIRGKEGFEGDSLPLDYPVGALNVTRPLSSHM